MSEFVFTPAILPWIRKHSMILNEADMASELGCATGTLRNICAKHGIVLCSESDKHAFIAEPPARAISAKEVALRFRVHPRLNPALRGNLHAGFVEMRPQRDAIAKLDRKAAELHTTAAVLAAVLIEIIAADNLFDAVLNLED